MNRKQIITLKNAPPFENGQIEIDLIHTRITGMSHTGKSRLLEVLREMYCETVTSAGGTDVEIEFADWSTPINMRGSSIMATFGWSFYSPHQSKEPVAGDDYDAIEFFFSRMVLVLTEKKYTCVRRKNLTGSELIGEERGTPQEEMAIVRQENGEIEGIYPFSIYKKKGRLHPSFTPEAERELGEAMMSILDAAWALAVNIDARSYLGVESENALHLSLKLPHAVFFDETDILLGASAADALNDNLRAFLPALRLFTVHQTPRDQCSTTTNSKGMIMVKNMYPNDPNLTQIQTVRPVEEVRRMVASRSDISSFLVNPDVTIIDTSNTFVFGDPDSGKSLLLRVIREMLPDLLKRGRASDEAIELSKWSVPVNMNRISPLSSPLPSFTSSGDVEKDYDAVEFFFGRILLAITDGKYTCCSSKNLCQFVTVDLASLFDPSCSQRGKGELYIVPSLSENGKPSGKIKCLFTVEAIGNRDLIANFGSVDGPFTNKLRAAWVIAAWVYNAGLRLNVTQFEDILKLPHAVFFDDVDFILEWMAARNLKDNLRKQMPNSRMFFSFRNPDWVYPFNGAMKLVADGVMESGKIKLKGESN